MLKCEQAVQTGIARMLQAVSKACCSCRYLRTGRLDNLLLFDELSQEMQAKRVFQVSSKAAALQ